MLVALAKVSLCPDTFLFSQIAPFSSSPTYTGMLQSDSLQTRDHQIEAVP